MSDAPAQAELTQVPDHHRLDECVLHPGRAGYAVVGTRSSVALQVQPTPEPMESR